MWYQLYLLWSAPARLNLLVCLLSYACLPVCLPAFVPACMPVCPSTSSSFLQSIISATYSFASLSVCVLIFLPSIHPFIHLPNHLSFHPSTPMSTIFTWYLFSCLCLRIPCCFFTQPLFVNNILKNIQTVGIQMQFI